MRDVQGAAEFNPLFRADGQI